MPKGVARMDDNNIKLFENKRVRTAWDEEKQEWYFSIVDVVEVLTGTDNPRRYWSDLKRKMKSEGSQLYEKIVQLKMQSADGKYYNTDVADTEQILRIIQSIPSPRAEPFKLWLANVGAERIDETIDPEIAIDRAFATYLRKGYSKEWIHQRILTLQVRNELTSEWDERGVKEGKEYAILTDEISKAWAGMTTRQYKNFKSLKKENLRDNMTTLELVLNMLAEATTTEISREQKPQTFEENKAVAREGGEVAGIARREAEKRTGKPVITSKKAVDFARLLTDVIDVKDEKDKE
jgi:prophage antirepressor-like protein